MDGVRDDGDYSASQGASASKRIKLETLSKYSRSVNVKFLTCPTSAFRL